MEIAFIVLGVFLVLGSILGRKVPEDAEGNGPMVTLFAGSLLVLAGILALLSRGIK